MPLLIFGAGLVERGNEGGALQWLGAVSLLLVAGAPFAAGAAIRAGRDLTRHRLVRAVPMIG